MIRFRRRRLRPDLIFLKMMKIKNLARFVRFNSNGPKLYPDEWIAPYPTSKANPVDDQSIPAMPPLPRHGELEHAKRARLVYASRKRGILETDLLLSTFIKKHLDGMTEKQLFEYDGLLNENDWDIYYWCTGARDVPAHISCLSFWDVLVEHSKNPRREILRMPSVVE